MKTQVGSKVHPWYKGTHEWQVKAIAGLTQPIQYNDLVQGDVNYDPKIMLLENEQVGNVLWFTYWILLDDQTKQQLERITRGGFPPRTGEVLPSVGKCPRWLITSVGELTIEDWSKTPPALYFPIYGHCI